MDKKFSARDIAFLGLIGVILFCAFFALKALDSSPAPTWAEVRTLIETHQVEDLYCICNAVCGEEGGAGDGAFL